MTLRYLLDTTVISAPVASTPDGSVVRKLEEHGHESAIAAPVWHELIFGVRRLPRGRRRTALTSYLEDTVSASLPILPYDETAAAWHGRERARLEGLGKSAPFVDGQIAAIAVVKDLILVTRNTKDFRRFDGLVVEDWSTKPRV